MITAPQSRMARGALGWSIRDLAREANVGSATVTRFENSQAEPIPATLAAIQRAFEAAGVEFRPDGAVRLRDQPIEAAAS